MAEHAAPIILVPGFWLGAWAWDEVAAALRAEGHDVTAITLPGLESANADRSSITMSDHVNAIVDAVEAHDAPVVLAVHSASGFSGYAASDRIPDRIAAMVYVDTAPGIGPLDADFEGVEKPMVWEEIEEEENLDGLSEEQKETFRQRAVPVPGGVVRGAVEMTNDARRDIPSTLICTGFSAEQYQTYAREHPDWAFLAGIPELRNASWVDLPTSHWPMWSRPQELAQIIGDVTRAQGEGTGRRHMRYGIEAITLPVTDVDRAKAFYEKAGWHLDVDTEPAPGIRIVQFTPPGSDCSITFGTGMPQSEPGSYRSTYLVVADIEPAHRELAERGIPVSAIFHFGPQGQADGLDPKRADYGSYATFADPDGNTWLLQEVPSRADRE